MAHTIASFDPGHGDTVHDVQLDYYGRRLATASSDRTIKVFDIAGDQVSITLLHNLQFICWALLLLQLQVHLNCVIAEALVLYMLIHTGRRGLIVHAAACRRYPTWQIFLGMRAQCGRWLGGIPSSANCLQAHPSTTALSSGKRTPTALGHRLSSVPSSDKLTNWMS